MSFTKASANSKMSRAPATRPPISLLNVSDIPAAGLATWGVRGGTSRASLQDREQGGVDRNEIEAQSGGGRGRRPKMSDRDSGCGRTLALSWRSSRFGESRPDLWAKYGRPLTG